MKTNQLIRGAVIASLYIAICFMLKPLSFGPVQLRISEALCILPIFLPEAILGLFIGCLVSNLIGGAFLIDVILGSVTTLFAAIATRYIYKKTASAPLALFPPVIFNALIVGAYVPFVYSSPGTVNTLPVIIFSILTVGIGQVIAVYVLGLPLAKALEKTKIFKN